jgi:hypothetical protein
MNTTPVHDRGARSNIAGLRTRPGATLLWILIVGLIARLGAAAIVEVASVTLAWDPPVEDTDGTPLVLIGGYKIYCGTASRAYSTVIDVGSVTTATVTNLPTGVTYFFAVTCYNTAGDESAFSEELTWTPDAGAGPELLPPYLTTGSSGTGFVVSWSSKTERYYAVERSTNLVAVPAFAPIASHVPGQTPSTAYTDTTATGRGPYFYRVQMEP